MALRLVDEPSLKPPAPPPNDSTPGEVGDIYAMLRAMISWKRCLQIATEGPSQPADKVVKSAAQWRSELSPALYQVARQKGTERAFSSDSCQRFEPGLYHCACCDQPLFDASEKFDSGTGWPSFTQPISEEAVAYHSDTSHGMVRIEATCNRCDAHLGHVFPDGPAPSGLRFCINAITLVRQAPSPQ